jgi:hypothetical protein
MQVWSELHNAAHDTAMSQMEHGQALQQGQQVAQNQSAQSSQDAGQQMQQQQAAQPQGEPANAGV